MVTWTSCSSATLQAAIDGGGRRAPVFVQLQADGARQDLLRQPGGQRRIPLAGKAEIQRQAVGGLEHHAM